MCSSLGKPEWAPRINDQLNVWCTVRTGSGITTKDVGALLILTMWTLWKHCNTIVFDGETPSKLLVVGVIEREGRNWSKADLFIGDVDSFIGGLVRWAS